MIETSDPSIAVAPGSGDEESGDIGVSRPAIGDLLVRLVDEVRALIAAEIAVYRAEATRRAWSGGIAASLLIAALTLAQGALIATLVGLVMLLAPMIGTGWSIVAVVGGALLIAAILAKIGIGQISRMIDPDRNHEV